MLSSLFVSYAIGLWPEVKKAMEHLLRLVESAPLVDLQHRVTELQMTNERPLERALMDRLRHVTLKGRTLTDMGSFAEAMATWRWLLHVCLVYLLFLCVSFFSSVMRVC